MAPDDIYNWWVVWNIWDVILPIDELIFFKMIKPPTSITGKTYKLIEVRYLSPSPVSESHLHICLCHVQ